MPTEDDTTGSTSREPWRWTRLPRVGAPPVVQQVSEDGCGAACAEMLLADRGVQVRQDELADKMLLPARPQDLARALSDHTGSRWLGGMLDPSAPLSWSFVHRVTELSGTWAALLQPQDRDFLGHWVVIDGIDNAGVVLVRDPVGEAYGITLHDFADLWRYLMGVVQEQR